MEKTIDQVQQVGSSVFDTTRSVLEVVINALKPVIDSASPIAQQAGEQALKLASPVVSEASKKAQEAIQNAGVDTEPVVSVAKVLSESPFSSSCQFYITILCSIYLGQGLLCDLRFHFGLRWRVILELEGYGLNWVFSVCLRMLLKNAVLISGSWTVVDFVFV